VNNNEAMVQCVAAALQTCWSSLQDINVPGPVFGPAFANLGMALRDGTATREVFPWTMKLIEANLRGQMS